MRKRIVRFLIPLVVGGFCFWVLNPNNSGMYKECGFVYQADCNAMRAFAASTPVPSPSATATPSGMQPLEVSPACYPMYDE